ncbi:MAG TPA: XRE family transcriptional regulator [Eggerthellaceae bacterium]|nr:XRE family transcriptional regulator [Eggerthellaceae bacterium]
MSYSNEQFGHRLMVARHDARMTQDQLAAAVGIDKGSVARYEIGAVTPGLDKAYALAVACGVTLDDLCPMGR